MSNNTEKLIHTQPRAFMVKPLSLTIMSLLLSTVFCVVASGCELFNSDDTPNPILIGNNFEITGSLPDVGEQAEFAAKMFVDEINTSGGVEIDGTRYPLALILADNQATEQGATTAATKLITADNVLVMVGPNPSNAAIAAGEVANTLETLMISPWSTNPNTTANRPWVFRVPFLDTFQGPVLANFASQQFGAMFSCVLFDRTNDYPSGLAESFKVAWEARHGAASVVAFESFTTGDEDFSTQLSIIKDAGCDFLFTPQYAHEVPLIVAQAQSSGLTIPILGSDSWGSPQLLEQCAGACEGYYFSAHYVAAGATGATKDFIDNYEANYGVVPGDVGALTWDALRLVVQALENCGQITGTLADDRDCLRRGMASIEAFAGITGTMTFDAEGDPIKCAVMVKIEKGAFTAFESACP